MSASRLSPVPPIIPRGAVIAHRYRVDEVIAEGGMGIVYRGFHLALEQPIAIKVVRAEYADDPEAVARFINEARAVAGLRSANVAQVLDVGRLSEGPPYMVLEYLEGTDLRAVLQKRGALSVPQAVDYLLQASEAIAEAHAVGIVHRDLKPENLFLTRLADGKELVKLIDFGISKRLGGTISRSYTQHGQSLGSPHYMAPEQMTSPDQVDARADVWSLGVVLFELLTDSVPFEGDSLPTTCAQVLCSEPPSVRARRPEVPAELEQVIVRCLQKDPARRFQTVRDLVEALVPFADSRRSLTPFPLRAKPVPAVPELDADGSIEVRFSVPPPTTPPPTTEQEQTPVPRVHSTTTIGLERVRRRRWPAVVALTVLALASLGGFVWGHGDLQQVRRTVASAGEKLSDAAAAAAARISAATSKPKSHSLSTEVGAAVPSPSSATPDAHCVHSAKQGNRGSLNARATRNGTRAGDGRPLRETADSSDPDCPPLEALPPAAERVDRRGESQPGSAKSP